MTTEQILESLTESQKAELEKDLKETENQINLAGKITSEEFGEVNINFRLANDTLFLNATVLFLRGAEGKLNPKIVRLIKFNTLDEYLDSINESRNFKDEWLKLK